jgi:glycosyltransferase involved in cell wall biosynthesis
MANAILELASNPARRLALGAAAKTRVECVFDASVMASAYRRVYTDLLSARR